MHQTRRTAAAAEKEVAVAKKATTVAAKKATATASSSSKRARTLSPSPAGTTPAADYDLGSFSPRRKRRAEEEDE